MRATIDRRIFQFFATATILVNSLTATGAELIFKRYDQGWTPAIRQYQTDLLDLMLARTEPQFGPYKIEVSTRPMGTKRARMALQSGNDINVMFATGWVGWGLDVNRVFAIDMPALNNLQGLRRLLIRPTDKARFDAVNSAQDFLQLRVGSGATWLDNAILLANHVPLIEAQGLENLQPMLHKNRFDYVALGALEVDSVLAATPVNTWEIYENLLIFYQLSMQLYAPKTQPEIAERLQAGFTMVKNNGELDALFNRHFAATISTLQAHKRRLVVLKNPDLTDSDNAKIVAEFIAGYGALLKPLE